jgi:hypothetical protein
MTCLKNSRIRPKKPFEAYSVSRALAVLVSATVLPL